MVCSTHFSAAGCETSNLLISGFGAQNQRPVLTGLPCESFFIQSGWSRNSRVVIATCVGAIHKPIFMP